MMISTVMEKEGDNKGKLFVNTLAKQLKECSHQKKFLLNLIHALSGLSDANIIHLSTFIPSNHDAHHIAKQKSMNLLNNGCSIKEEEEEETALRHFPDSMNACPHFRLVHQVRFPSNNWTPCHHRLARIDDKSCARAWHILARDWANGRLMSGCLATKLARSLNSVSLCKPLSWRL